MRFLHPVHVGSLVTITARVTAVWRTSLETAVEVEAQNVLTSERQHTCSAFVVFVCLEENERPAALPSLVLVPD